jgi:hypothetical protein
VDELADWGEFFSGFSPAVRRPLLVKLQLSGRRPLENLVQELEPGPFDQLERFKADVLSVSAPESRALETAAEGVADLEFSGLTRPYDMAGWLYVRQPSLFEGAVELVRLDQGFNKPTIWSGFQIDSPFSGSKSNPDDPTLKRALASYFATARLPDPTIRIIALNRPSTRSDSRAVVLVISVEGASQAHRVFKGKKGNKVPTTDFFSPEHRAAVVIDDKALTVDVVSSALRAAVRKKIAESVLEHLGVARPKLDRLKPRWVEVGPLADRFEFRFDPEKDGVLGVRLVGARLSRQSGGVVNLDARDCDAEDAWKAWASWARTNGDTFGAVKMLGATLEFTFPDAKSSCGERQRALRLYAPYGLATPHWPKPHQQTAQLLLKRWGLLMTGPAAR